MRTKTEGIEPNDDVNEVTTHPEIRMQEQFIRQVKDASLPADQVLTQQNNNSQNNDTATRDSAPLFVP
jgi:hypothetical protein